VRAHANRYTSATSLLRPPARLASRLGTVLHRERGALTQQQLGDRAKLHRVTTARMEEGGGSGLPRRARPEPGTDPAA
jgi:hypothetical protein